MHLLQCFGARRPPIAAPSSTDTLGQTSLVVDCCLVPSSIAVEAESRAILPRSIAAVTYLRGTYAAGFSVFACRAKKMAALCTPV